MVVFPAHLSCFFPHKDQVFSLWVLPSVYQCTLKAIQHCITVRKPPANCKQERMVSTLLSRTQISSVELQSETLISDATLLCFVQGQLFHISQLWETQTLTSALINVLQLRVMDVLI